VSRCSNLASLLDDLLGAGEERRWHFKAALGASNLRTTAITRLLWNSAGAVAGLLPLAKDRKHWAYKHD